MQMNNLIPHAAVEKAIEGGWRLKNQHIPADGDYFVALIDNGAAIKYQVQNKAGEPKDNDYANVAEIALDPTFWQALGKALGWGLVLGWEEMYAPAENAAQEWYQNAFRFYDLILTGGDTEAYWKDLLK